MRCGRPHHGQAGAARGRRQGHRVSAVRQPRRADDGAAQRCRGGIPGASPLERLIAGGAERIAWILEFGELARAADEAAHNRFDVPAAVLWHRHLEMLLREAGFTADPWLMATALGATLAPERLLHAVGEHQVAPERLAETWRELVTRIVGGA
jgi:hypothetical protein